jgi:hypothetical protein
MTGAGTGNLVFTNADLGSTYGVALGLLYVKHLRWVRATTAGHLCIVKAANGDKIFESEADGAKFIDVHPLYKFVNGINIDTLDSGSLYVYLA